MIYVVDDQRDLCDVMTRQLVARGHAAVAFTSGDAVLAAIERQRPELIVLDYMMPDLDGLQVLQRIRANPATSDLPVLFYSGYDFDAARSKAQQLGALGWYVKSRHDLPNVIAEAAQNAPGGAAATAPAQSPGIRAGVRERRRVPRAPYMRLARLELTTVTTTPGSSASPTSSSSARHAPVRREVRTIDASSWGVGLASGEPLDDGEDAVLLIDAPDGTALRIRGKLLNARKLPHGGYGGAIAFFEEQPLLSALRIDHARYGA
jgi:CheY-like chemotaxis protein